MASSQNDGDKQPTPPDRSTVILLLGDLVDTTWRMFVPTIGGTLLGWWADHAWHTFPWLSIAGLLVGCLVSAMLIKDLFTRVKNVK